MIRQAAVAGTFYPENRQVLNQMLDKYLNDALVNAKTEEKVPKAIIVPHAGYIYSAAIAATAYARLKPAHKIITRVIIIGPSHRVAVHGVALSESQTFSTPLGNIAVDIDAVQSIGHFSFVEYMEAAHFQEHSIEVQLPFLQKTLDSFKIVPIVTGNASTEQVSQIINALWGGEETLIVISSDLSHYLDYSIAKLHAPINMAGLLR